MAPTTMIRKMNEDDPLLGQNKKFFKALNKTENLQLMTYLNGSEIIANESIAVFSFTTLNDQTNKL